MAALPIVIAIAGVAMQAYSSMSQGAAASSAANYNSQIEARNAEIALAEGNSQATIQQRQSQQMLGAVIAGYSAGDSRGLGQGSITMAGSPIDVLGMDAANAELSRQNILYNANLRSIGYAGNASLDASQPRVAMTQGITSAGADLLSGGANVIRMLPPSGGQTMPGTSPNLGSQSDPNT